MSRRGGPGANPRARAGTIQIDRTARAGLVPSAVRREMLLMRAPAEFSGLSPFADEAVDRPGIDEFVGLLRDIRDLAVAFAEKNEPAATRQLLNACWAGPESAGADWSEEDLQAIEERLAEADPLAEIRLHFDCPNCSASFDETLDLGDFVWAEIEREARRILQDVHLLASAYGWSESEILSLGPARRSVYLEMVLA